VSKTCCSCLFRKLHDSSGLTLGDDDNLSNNSKEETDEEDYEDALLDKSSLSNPSFLSPYFFTKSEIVPQKSLDLSNADALTSSSATSDRYLPRRSPSLPLAAESGVWWRENYFCERWRLHQKNSAKDESSERLASQVVYEQEDSNVSPNHTIDIKHE